MIESMNGMKITLRITGLSENLGRDNGTESPYWVPQICYIMSSSDTLCPLFNRLWYFNTI